MDNNQKNIKPGIVGRVIVGLLLLFSGILLLWINEQNAFKTSEAISEAKSKYIDVNSSRLDNNNNDKLIATKGELKIPLVGVTDSDFNVQTKSAKLVRKVEMYQWTESCDDENGKEKCRYEKTWNDELINSNDFSNKAYQNPSKMPYSNETFLAQDVTVGAYNLDDTLLNKLEANKKLTVYNNEITMNLGLRSNDDYYTNVQNNSPQIGDIRISYTYSDATNVSILAVQNNDTLKPFVSSNGHKVYEIKSGNLTGAEILQSLTNQNNTQKWLIRLTGTIFIIISFILIISPLQFLANFIPIFGTIFGWITSLASVVIGLAISLIIIALSWLFYRPLFSIILLIIGVGIILLIKKFMSQKNSSKKINSKDIMPNKPIEMYNLDNSSQTITLNQTNSNIENTLNEEIETLDLDNQDPVQNPVPNYLNFQSQNINSQMNYQNIDTHLNNYTQTLSSNTNNSVDNSAHTSEDIEVLDLDDQVQDTTSNYNQNINTKINYPNSNSNINADEATKLE